MDYNLLIDILLGLVMIVGLGLFHEVTSYMTFNWYMIVVIIPLFSVCQVASLVKSAVDVKSNLHSITETKSIDIWYLCISLLFWLIPIVIDTGVASLSAFIKYQVVGSISMNDVYLICEIIPISLLLIPCFFVKLREILPKYTQSYIYESMGILGIAANILVLVFGGWLTVTLINT
jgi:hypothetical protein